MGACEYHTNPVKSETSLFGTGYIDQDFFNVSVTINDKLYDILIYEIYENMFLGDDDYQYTTNTGVLYSVRGGKIECEYEGKESLTLLLLYCKGRFISGWISLGCW